MYKIEKRYTLAGIKFAVIKIIDAYSTDVREHKVGISTYEIFGYRDTYEAAEAFIYELLQKKQLGFTNA